MISGKKILVCPLNWGLGHAARCIPIIQKLIENGNEIIIAADGFPLSLLQKEFPSIPTIQLKSYSIRYSKRNSQVGAMIRFLPKLISGIIKEHLWLNKFLKKEKIDLIISDNRFGLWNKQIYSIYITHQVMIKMPQSLRFLEPVGYYFHKKIIKKYDECWIPDNENGILYSGDLSHLYQLPDRTKFIGVLSRFSKWKEVEPNNEFETIVILSGVEPQRTLFEEKMLKYFCHSKGKTLIVEGKPTGNEENRTFYRNITIFSHLEDEKLAACLKGCQTIVSRSGYSTVMDLAVLGLLHKAFFYPTPGQTEQEYLAERLFFNNLIHGFEQTKTGKQFFAQKR